MKEAIRKRALELGFDDCRFATAAAPETGNRLQHWLGSGQHGEMGYLQRNAEKRVDPQRVLAGAQSVICLAASYEIAPGVVAKGNLHVATLTLPLSPGERENSAPIQVKSGALRLRPANGIIARYARFADYHDVLGERLKSLTAYVSELGGTDTRSLWYVDTGPVLEREFAQRAGIGFVGKHTNVISRKFGNWIFLAEILTTVELEPDAPERNRCGSCSRCITACPTNAITAPFQLDSRLCISYLTIELKGSIPVELRPLIGNRIYGCDDCLAACPWNRFAHEGSLMKPHLRDDLSTPDLIELLKLDEAGFKQKFAGTPMLRTKRRGLLRNVCVALGNVGDENALPELRKACQDPEPLVAEHARWAVDRLSSS
jgi:epoxyqueuosine reductase